VPFLLLPLADAVAAVGKPYTYHYPGEVKLLFGRFGAWLEKEFVRHAPRRELAAAV
jgi:hypothetical protein